MNWKEFWNDPFLQMALAGGAITGAMDKTPKQFQTSWTELSPEMRQSLASAMGLLPRQVAMEQMYADLMRENFLRTQQRRMAFDPMTMMFAGQVAGRTQDYLTRVLPQQLASLGISADGRYVAPEKVLAETGGIAKRIQRENEALRRRLQKEGVPKAQIEEMLAQRNAQRDLQMSGLVAQTKQENLMRAGDVMRSAQQMASAPIQLFEALTQREAPSPNFGGVAGLYGQLGSLYGQKQMTETILPDKPLSEKWAQTIQSIGAYLGAKNQADILRAQLGLQQQQNQALQQQQPQPTPPPAPPTTPQPSQTPPLDKDTAVNIAKEAVGRVFGFKWDNQPQQPSPRVDVIQEASKAVQPSNKSTKQTSDLRGAVMDIIKPPSEEEKRRRKMEDAKRLLGLR